MLFKKIDIKSQDAMPSGIDFFDTPMTNVAVDKSEEREFILKNAISSVPYIFQINTGTQYMDPKSVRIGTRWKLRVKTSGDSGFRNISRTLDGTKQIIEYIGLVNG